MMISWEMAGSIAENRQIISENKLIYLWIISSCQPLPYAAHSTMVSMLDNHNFFACARENLQQRVREKKNDVEL